MVAEAAMVVGVGVDTKVGVGEDTKEVVAEGIKEGEAEEEATGEEVAAGASTPPTRIPLQSRRPKRPRSTPSTAERTPALTFPSTVREQMAALGLWSAL